MKIRTCTLFIAAACFACGGSSTPAAPAATAQPVTTSGTAAGPEHQEQHASQEDHEKHHEGLSPALHDFHGVLAPVWHSAPGTERVGKACDGVKAMGEKAKATADAELIADVAAVETACAKEGRSEVEAKLTAVHQRFHALAPPKQH
jgi:hypothetical protein